MGTHTHIYAVLDIPELAYRVIAGRLEDAGYSEKIIWHGGDPADGIIDMHGIALRAEKCDHDPSNVIADVLEGDAKKSGVALQWCSCCGSIRRIGTDWKGDVVYTGKWREPIQ